MIGHQNLDSCLPWIVPVWVGPDVHPCRHFELQLHALCAEHAIMAPADEMNAAMLYTASCMKALHRALSPGKRPRVAV